MIAIDTNVLLRLITGDVPEQAARALALVEACEAQGQHVLITIPVLVETVGNLAWRRYRFDHDRIAGTVQRLLDAPTWVVEQRDAVVAALRDFRHEPGDFTDHLIRHLARANGADVVHTFDQALLGQHGFAAV